MTEKQQLADAIAIANIPTLLMVLVQLTGDKRWIAGSQTPTAPSAAVAPATTIAAALTKRFKKKFAMPHSLPF